ncbi:MULTISPECIES: hybrid sensor histidine kinase/response regulator transcription factor [unclassified Carboxylicivirga]|uniref:hybrid sensor histidine kinase/response regulator transcription factor n=1 Tax=Carboxylicivirga TaxID=1628153 RepID=UPI003D3402BD
MRQLLLFVCLMVFQGLFASTSSEPVFYRAKSVSGNYGLSQNSVHSIVRDHVGYIWMGTAHGLNRFDGNQLKKYFHHAGDAYSISSNTIHRIHEDSNGDIWVLTSGGINRYLRADDRFVRYVFSNTLTTSCVYETENELWFPDRAWKIHVYNKTDRTYSLREIKPQFTPHNNAIYIEQITPYDRGHLLIGTYYSGLFLYDIQSGALTRFSSISGVATQGMVKLHDRIFCAMYSRIFQLSSDGKVQRVLNKDNSGLQSHIILDMEWNPQDSTLWVATDGAGIQVFDTEFRLVNTLQIGPKASDVLNDNSINDITFGPDGLILLGTVRSGGLMLYPSYFEQFPYVNQSKYGPSNKTILCFYQDDENRIWLGTDGGGLNRFDPETSTFDHYSIPDALKITSVAQFSPEVLLVGSYTRGLYFFNKRSHRFSDAHQHPLFAPIQRNVMHSLFLDSQGDLWVSDGRLSRIDLKNNRMQVLSDSIPAFFHGMSPAFTSAVETRDGLIWFATRGGMFAWSIQEQKLTQRITLNNSPASYGRSVNSITEDQYGNLVFGTNKGLLYYDFDKKQLSSYISDVNYKNLMFQSVYMDANNHLWVGANEGIIRISKTDSNEQIFMFNTLGNKSGLEYFQGSLLKSTDGFLNMGSNEGVTRFNPNNIEPHLETPNTVITSLSMLSTEQEELKDSLLALNVIESSSLTIPYTPASFQFNFNAFDIPFSESTQYAYQLHPFEKIWHTGKSNVAIYSNLPPGSYTFKVKAQNRNGIWSPKDTQIQLTILPPWYKTWWFSTLMLLLLMALAYVIWRASLQRAKLRQEVKIKETEKERLHEINQMKLRFFTNISHELKTPLTLIYNPLDHLVKSGGSESEFRTMLPFLYRNAQRMTMLIDQILDFRKAELSVLRLAVSEGDIVASCRNILTYFAHQARIEHIKLHLWCQPEKIDAWYDADMLFKIISNLVSNALKNTPDGGEVSLRVFTRDKEVIIEVEDTGDGIPPEEQELIFERYYQVGNKVKGTGIGLALTHRLVQLHHGYIKVSSAAVKGAVFTVGLPLGNSHFNKDDFAMEGVVPFVEPEPLLADAAPTCQQSMPQGRILIVEDEWELREYIAGLLEKSFSVLKAKNGEEALEMLHGSEPDLIISDVMMPRMDGITFCKKLKSDIRISHIPVLMLTAKTAVENQIEGLKSGADAYMPKPFDTQLLFSQIQTILNNRKIVKERFGHDLGLQTSDVTQSEADEKFLHKAISIVEQNMDNPDFDVTAFVEQMAMSRTLVYNKIKAIAGKPVKDFIINIKLRKAAGLLKNSRKSISEIAMSCGFADPSYFSVVFKRHFKQSPTSYRSGA